MVAARKESSNIFLLQPIEKQGQSYLQTILTLLMSLLMKSCAKKNPVTPSR